MAGMDVGRIKKWFFDNKALLFVTAFFFVYAVVMTWPFAIHPNSTLPAPLVGDVSNSVSKFSEIKRDGLDPFFDSRIPTISAPDGVRSNVGVDRVSFFSTLFLWITTNVTSALFAESALVFLGYFLTGLITFLFIRSVTGSSRIAFLAGFIYSFFPLFISLARAAPIYDHMWLYILPVWAFIKLAQVPGKKNLLLAIFSIVPALFWTPYYSFHILLVGLASIVVYSALLYRRSGVILTLKTVAIISVSWLAFCALYYVIGMSSSSGDIPVRTLQEAYDQSVQPLMYVLPPAFSWWGVKGYDFLYHHIPRAKDTNLYLGVSVLIITGIGTVSLVTRRIRTTLPSNIKILGAFAAAVIILAFGFSLAPTIGIFGINIPTPNYLVTHFVPALRASQRLTMPLMLGVVMMTSVGLYVVFKKISKKYLAITTIGIFIIMAFDLSIHPPQLTSLIPTNASMAQLSTLKTGITAQYVNGSLVGDPAQLPCQTQFQHHQPLFNHCGMDMYRPASLAPGQMKPVERYQIATLTLSSQLDKLATLHIRYVIVNRSDRRVVDALQENNGAYKKIISDSRYFVYTLKVA